MYAILSIFLRRAATICPIFFASISTDSPEINSRSISSTILLISSSETVVFSGERTIPDLNFSRSNCSRLPSFFLTIKRTFSIRSYVVYLLPQDEHVLLLLILVPSSDTLVSTTSESGLLQ